MIPERDATTIELANAWRYSEIAPQYAADWRGKLDSEQQQNLDKFLSILGEGSKTILDVGCSLRVLNHRK